MGPRLRTVFHTALVMSLLAGATQLEAQTSRPASAPKVRGNVTYSGTLWQKAKYDIRGLFQIVESNGKQTLVLSKDFRTRSGPDLKVVLSPKEFDDVTGKNALDGGLNLGLLSSNKGAQNIAIPRGADLSKYRTLLIHCEEYSVLWGGVALRPGKVVGFGTEWTKKSKKATGAFEIVVDGDRTVIRLADNFKTSSAPDLKFVLTNTTPRRASNKNALKGGTIVGLLESNRGAQEVVVPKGVDVSSFKTLLIHCEQYTKLWAAATIQRP